MNDKTFRVQELTINTMVVDAERDNGRENISKLAASFENRGLPHIWNPAGEAGINGFSLTILMKDRKCGPSVKAVMQIHDVTNVELYPKQDRLFGGPGSLVRLQFGRHKISGQRYPFINPNGEILTPSVREQIYILSAHQNVPEEAFSMFVAYQSERQRPRVSGYSIGSVGSTDFERIKSAILLMSFLGFKTSGKRSNSTLSFPRRPQSEFRGN